jgi:CSLREA domain-containing protein
MNRYRAVAALACAVPLLAVSSAHAATITVDTESDAPGACSLREAITAATSDAPAGTCAAGSGADTIALPAGRYDLSIPGAAEDANASGDLDVTAGELTLSGAGASRTTISAGRIDRVLDVAADATVSIEGVTITDGLAPAGAPSPDVHAFLGVNATAAPGDPGQPGGGILNAGALTVSHSVVTGNATGAGGAGGSAFGGNGNPGRVGSGGDGGPGGSGGGLFSSGALTLRDTTVSGNLTGNGGDGGGGFGGSGSDAVANASGAPGGNGFGGDSGTGGGGGGVGATGPLTIARSTVVDNVTGSGGEAGSANGGNAGDGSGTGNGGTGGSGISGAGGHGGDGGGVLAQGALDVSASAIARNRAGNGGPGGPVLAADGGSGGATNGNGGDGGTSTAGVGGGGGTGGGLWIAADATLENVTVDSNATGRGGLAGIVFPLGGKGGNGFGTGSGGHGGHSNGGSGGAGGRGGGIVTLTPLSVGHATISRNDTGGGAGDSLPIGGAGGPGGANGAAGAHGTVNQGSTGEPGSAGAIAVIGSDTATVRNSIFAWNGPDNCFGLVADAGGNVRTGSCAGGLGDPRLGPLDDNGGGVPTRSLRSGSAAVDLAGSGCAATDARGVARPQGAGCDAGAYERALPSPATGEASDLAPSGATLAGTVAPNGRATSHFELGTGTGYGTRTADSESEAPRAPVTGLAPATTYHYRLVATNRDGTSAGEDRTFTTPAAPGGPGGSGGSPDSTRPLVSELSAKPRRFAVGKNGTTLRYRLSENARVVFTVTPRCGKRTCRRSGRFAQRAHAGIDKRRFTGKLGRRTLKRGRYTLTVVATDAAGNRSAPRRLALTVVPKKTTSSGRRR